MPSQLFDALVVIFFHELLALVRIAYTHETFQESIGIFQLAHLVRQVSTYIQNELIVTVCHKLFCQNLLDFITERFFARYRTFFKDLVKQLLIQFSFLETCNLLHLETEIRSHSRHIFLLDFQQRSDFHVMAVVCLVRIEDQYVVHLATVEHGLLLVVLHIFRQQDGIFNLYATFFRISILIQFGQQPLYHVLSFVAVHMVITTCTLGVHLHLAVDHFVIHLDVIIIHRVFTAQFSLELGSQSQIESKRKLFHRIEVNILLTVFARKRLAQNIQIVFLDVSIQFLT